MISRTSRRAFMQTTGAALALAGSARFVHAFATEPAAQGAPNAEKLGWRLGCQAYSFNRFTFQEALDKNASLGLKVIEAYPGQRLSPEKDVQTNPGMSADDRKLMKQMAADRGITIPAFGVVHFPGEEGEARKMFDFAKEMGIETFTCEPAPEQFDMLEKLCGEYGVNCALHNHPKPSRYWDSQTVLDVCQGRGKWIGACADTGHWVRSELDPLAQIKKLEGRIISFHFKDLNQMGPGAHDVPWGTGVNQVKEAMIEIKRQGFQGVFSIEYEYNWDNSVPDIAKCVDYFNQVAGELA